MSLAAWSIRKKLLALLAGTVALTQIATLGVAAWQELTRSAETRRDVLLATSQVLATSVAAAVAERDANRVYAAMRSIGRIPGLLYVGVVDRDGRALADLGAAEQLSSDARLEADSGIIPALTLARSRTVEMATPIVHGGVEVGRLRLVAAGDDFMDSLVERIGGAIFVAAAVMAIAFALAAPLLGRILGPLLALGAAMTRISRRHDYAVSLDPGRRDEVGSLVASFNTMIDEIRQRDQRLKLHREQLEATVAERTREYVAARDAAEAASRSKSDFLATMSHEIRTPMNGILVTAELMASGAAPPRLRRHAEVIARSGQNLLAIINDILDFSKIEAGRLDFDLSSVDPGELVEQALALFHERARAAGVDLAARIEMDAPRVITVDPARLTQVLTNLVGNAVKFTQAGRILVTMRMDRDRPDMLRIEVADTGVGIARDKLAHIFEAFSQADQSVARRFGGTGLGLAISKRIVTAMGGTISVDSAAGHGSTFTIVIPAKAQPHPLPMAPRGARAAISVAGAATSDALGYYLRHGGVAVEAASPEDLAEAARGASLVIADAATLQSMPRLEARHVVALADPLEGADEEALVADGRADLSIQRPLSRADVESVIVSLAEGGPLRLARARAGVVAATRSHRGRRVLVVDDNAVNRDVAAEALARFGVTVDLAEDGAQAIAMAAAQAYDLILMDASMPDLDGYEATRRIRAAEAADGRTPAPIVALTAQVVGADPNAWRNAGMNGLLAKPFTMRALGDCLAAWLGAGEDAAAAPAQAPDTSAGALDPATIAQLRDIAARGREDFLQRVVGLYDEHAPKAAAEMVAATREGRFADAARAAHALKSMSGNVGARRVAQICSDIEQLAGGAQAGQTRELARDAADAVEQARGALARLVAETAPAPTRQAATR
ncbi:MAG: response regulator [Methylobacteriaceae bacterium]|nr:response regulator [Methylobacteriaceae bacterium]